MTKIFSPPAIDSSQKILCCYCNSSDEPIIVRMTYNTDYQWERVLFPKEGFFFQTSPDAALKIYRQTIMGVRQDIIPCIELQISQ